MIGATLLLYVVGLPLTTAVPAASSVAALLVAHALFVNGPVDTMSAPVADQSASSGHTFSGNAD
jgi:hypothetical protein